MLMNELQNGINSTARNAYSGIAAATALTMIPEVDKDKTVVARHRHGGLPRLSGGGDRRHGASHREREDESRRRHEPRRHDGRRRRGHAVVSRERGTAAARHAFFATHRFMEYQMNRLFFASLSVAPCSCINRMHGGEQPDLSTPIPSTRTTACAPTAPSATDCSKARRPAWTLLNALRRQGRCSRSTK